jgi:hypothetical protein
LWGSYLKDVKVGSLLKDASDKSQPPEHGKKTESGGKPGYNIELALYGILCTYIQILFHQKLLVAIEVRICW